ncbi:MAG TPA: hypothetical protein VK195_13600 [Burkholderiaceae bacterium]|nr:hypothetical protein [Burkholderiaceae bacterium]
MDGLLCAALCLDLAQEPVAVLDAHWGEDWAEALMEQELLDEFMPWLEERWQTLSEALDPALLEQAPDALPLAQVLPWAVAPGHRALPSAARDWASGFLCHADSQSKSGGDVELLGVISALTLEAGAALEAYLHQAYDRPKDIGASALIDDALFAAQDLRRSCA